jgi:Ca2+:H+ antiporter
LKENLVTVVQASLIGSILSNLLLVLGFCFLLGGLVPHVKNSYQSFDHDLANLDSGLLSLVVLSFIIPAAFVITTGNEDRVVELSRGTAVILFVTYIAFLVFQLGTHVSIQPSLYTRHIVFKDSTD